MLGDEVDVTVVLPVKNGAAFIEDQLTALCAQETDFVWSLMVVDNGSTDGTRKMAEAYQDQFPGPMKILDASEARGLSEVRNAAVRASQADKLLWCDADDVVHPQWVARLSGALDDFDIVAGSIDHELLNHELLRYRGRGHAASRPPVNQGFLPFAPGANFGFRRSLFERLDGFDCTIGSAEDVDFSWRAQLDGFELGFEPEAIVYYRFHSTARAVFRQAFAYGCADVRLYRKFRVFGIPRRGLFRSMRKGLWLLRNLGNTRGALDEKLRWVREFGYNAGRIKATFEWDRSLRRT